MVVTQIKNQNILSSTGTNLIKTLKNMEREVMGKAKATIRMKNSRKKVFQSHWKDFKKRRKTAKLIYMCFSAHISLCTTLKLLFL